MTASGNAPASLRPAIILLALALAARVAFVFSMPDRLLWSDGREYAAVASSLLHHHGYGLQTLRPPGYPTFLAAVWSITGEHLLPLRLVEAVLGTVSVGLIGWLGTRWFGARAGLLAMGLAALHPVLAFLPASGYSENLVVLVTIVSFGAALTALTRDEALSWRWALAGAGFGVAVLIRPNVVMLVPGLLAGIVLSRRRAGRAWLASVLTLLVTLGLVLTPWVVRNHRVHGEWFFVATGGGRALWLGNNAQASGRSNTLTVPDSSLETRLAALPDEVSKDRALAAAAGEWARAHPLSAARLYFVKLGSLYAPWPETYSRTLWMNPWARATMGVASIVLFTGVLLGLAALWRSPLLAPMVLAVVSFSLVNAAFFMVMRYRMPFEPLLAWIAGAGWAHVLGARARPGA